MTNFCSVNNLNSLNEEPTCLINPNNLSCIDLFVTNRSRYFQNTSTVETDISDFQKLVEGGSNSAKNVPEKQNLTVIQCRNYKAFNKQLFRIEMGNKLATIDLNNAHLAEFHDEFW